MTTRLLRTSTTTKSARGTQRPSAVAQEKGKGEAGDDEEEHASLEFEAWPGMNSGSAGGAAAQQNAAFDAAVNALSEMAAALGEEKADWNEAMQRECESLCAVLEAGGHTADAMMWNVRIRSVVVRMRARAEAELWMGESMTADQKASFHAEVERSLPRPQCRWDDSVGETVALAGPLAKVVAKGRPSSAAQFACADAQMPATVKAALSEFFHENPRLRIVDTSQLDTTETANTKKARERMKFCTPEEDKFMHSLTTFWCDRGLINETQVQLQTLADLSFWWAAFYGDEAADKRCLWGESDLSAKRKLMKKRLDQSRDRFVTNARKDLRGAYLNLPRETFKAFRSEA